MFKRKPELGSFFVNWSVAEGMEYLRVKNRRYTEFACPAVVELVDNFYNEHSTSLWNTTLLYVRVYDTTVCV